MNVTSEPLDDDLPLAQMAERGGAFEFLTDEPDLYREADIGTNVRVNCDADTNLPK